MTKAGKASRSWLIGTALVALLPVWGCGREPEGHPEGRRTKAAPPAVAASAPLARQESEPAVTTRLGSQKASELRAAAKSANLVIVVMDAARADHLGCYGYPRETTPNLDRLAMESVVFESYFVTYSQTKASTASLFTGLHPYTHLVMNNQVALCPGAFTIAKGLGEAGFQTILLSSNPLVSKSLGLGVDFQTVFEPPASVKGGRARRRESEETNQWNPEGIVQRFGIWLDSNRSSRFFAYIHLLPPHLPYDAPEEMVRLFTGPPPNAWQGGFQFPKVEPRERGKEPPPLEEWVNRYDANLRWADWAVGEIEQLLRENDLLDNTLFVVTSDHGEAFGEHGYKYHGRGVFEELVHAPLLVRLPGEKHMVGRVPALTQTTDLLPTVFDLFGVEHPRDLQGKSLVSLLTRERGYVHDYIYATCAGHTPSYLVRDQRWALLLYEDGDTRALYDLKKDAKQRENVIEQEPEQAAKMIEAFREFAKMQADPPLKFVDPKWRSNRRPTAPRVKMSDEQKRELKALGYVD